MASTTATDRFTEFADIYGISRKEAKRRLGAKRRKAEHATRAKQPAVASAAPAPAPQPEAAPAAASSVG